VIATGDRGVDYGVEKVKNRFRTKLEIWVDSMEEILKCYNFGSSPKRKRINFFINGK